MIDKLRELGLTEKESEAYVELAKVGRITANQLAKRTSTHRTVTYNILQQLIQKGLVTYVKREKKRYYTISDPDHLMVRIKEQERMARDVIEEIKTITPNMPSHHSVEVYEGKEGMKSIHEELLKTEEIRVLNSTGLIFDHLKYSASHILDELSKKATGRIIGISSMRETLLGEYLKYDQVKYLPAEADNYATTFIFGGKVIIQVLKDRPFLVKIENKEVYEGFKKDFDVLWDRL